MRIRGGTTRIDVASPQKEPGGYKKQGDDGCDGRNRRADGSRLLVTIKGKSKEVEEKERGGGTKAARPTAGPKGKASQVSRQPASRNKGTQFEPVFTICGV